MAAITSRFVARLLTSIHTTPALRSTPTRTIASFKGLQSLAQPGRIPSEEEEEEKEISFMSSHLDALSSWHEDAEKMSQIRLHPFNNELDVQEIVREQVVELLEDLAESSLLDPRTGWLAKSHQ